ncbi:C-type lectin domain family 10 member A [Bicyclus anynana]|uniref:C-type lectin domain family 10 member A n=1 Tax=Bicyclus anynana TaxID=110368 RepID=A0A6J1NUI1_BICAN|nr:C-type lectin domain family 10 member A [Bicyclus anynana]
MFTKVLYLTLLLACCGSIECKNFRSDYKYHNTVDAWLKFHAVPGTWREAQQRCFLEGAILASPVDAAWQAAIIAQINATTSNGANIYTGIHSIYSKGYFHSIEGVPLAKMSLQWMSGQPDNFGNSEDCIVYSRGEIADVNCSEVFPFVCYKNSIDNTSVMPCGTIDKKYEFVADTGSCYKFHSNHVTWAEAYKFCAAEGAYLAVINNKEEANRLAELHKKHYPQSTEQYVTLIGVHDAYKDGIWRTIQGQTLEVAGYAEWERGQPDNAGAGKACGAMFPNGKLDDFWCNQDTKFLCEKDPNNLQDS